MNSQPFDYYKNKDVEYDYILNATVNNVDTVSNDMVSTIIELLKDEDLLKMYFKKVSLGRVYGKVSYNNSQLYFTFGISLVDTNDRPTSKEIIQYIKDFILSLNKNIDNKKINIKESDIKVDIITENKYSLDNIDKKLVNESIISFNRGNDNKSLSLTSDGIVERYANGVLCGTMPFSKLGIVRECKSLVADGYSLTLKTEATINSNNENAQNRDDEITLDNPDEVKKDLEQDIKDVDEIQTLKDELDDKLDKLNEDTDSAQKYVLVLYTNIDGDYQPDVCLKGIDGENYVVADDIEDADVFSKEDAEKYAELFNKKSSQEGNKFILKAVNLDDITKLSGLYESKETKTNSFPSSDFTKQVMTANQLKLVDIENDLDAEQIEWLRDNIGNIYEIKDGLKNFVNEMSIVDGNEEIISLDDYFNELNSKLKGEL